MKDSRGPSPSRPPCQIGEGNRGSLSVLNFVRRIPGSETRKWVMRSEEITMRIHAIVLENYVNSIGKHFVLPEQLIR